MNFLEFSTKNKNYSQIMSSKKSTNKKESTSNINFLNFNVYEKEKANRYIHNIDTTFSKINNNMTPTKNSNNNIIKYNNPNDDSYKKISQNDNDIFNNSIKNSTSEYVIADNYRKNRNISWDKEYMNFKNNNNNSMNSFIVDSSKQNGNDNTVSLELNSQSQLYSPGKSSTMNNVNKFRNNIQFKNEISPSFSANKKASINESIKNDKLPESYIYPKENNKPFIKKDNINFNNMNDNIIQSNSKIAEQTLKIEEEKNGLLEKKKKIGLNKNHINIYYDENPKSV